MDILKKVLYGVLFMAVFVGGWFLLDFLYSQFISKSEFVFAANDIIFPALIGLAVYLVLFVFVKKKSK